MKTCFNSGFLLIAALTFALLLCARELAAAEAPAATQAETTPPDEAQQALRANLLLQDQVRTLQRTLDDYRQQVDASSKRSEEAVGARLNLVEQSLKEQRERELEALRSADRIVLFVAVAFAVAGILTMLFTAWFHMRTMQRVTEITASLRLGALPALALGEGLAPGPGSVALTSQRYLNEVERLQKRVSELEHLAAPAASPGNGHAEDAVEPQPVAGFPGRGGVTRPATDLSSQTAVLLGKGQTFLNLEQPERALACFDEALALEPDQVDALIKRGAALERLQRFDDAIATYDRVIGLDGRLTTAYLLKGGVYNRLKRFSDALTCYDQALKVQSPNKA